METKKLLTANQAISLLKDEDIINGWVNPLPSASISMHYKKGEIIAKIEMSESLLELFLWEEKPGKYRIALTTTEEKIILEIDEEKLKKMDPYKT